MPTLTLPSLAPAPAATHPDHPHPRPLHALRIDGREQDGSPRTLVVRTWTREAAAACRLCLACDAEPGARRTMVCVRGVAGELPGDRDSVELLSLDGLVP